MSSYKTDSTTGLSVYYLKNNKEALQEWFYTEYSNSVKITTFYKYLQSSQYKYKKNLGSLCSICNMYGYEIFDELRVLVQCYTDLDHQVLNSTY